jgi:regulator of RNase E activity RraA
MSGNAPYPADLAALAAFDTPTICNALEVVLPQRRGGGYTTRPAVCGFPELKPIVGFARTARIRSRQPPSADAASVRKLRHDYYRYVDAGPKPSIVVIQDLDGTDAGYGAFWGEVQSTIHRGLGALGVITDGSVRDLDQWAHGFQFLASKIAPSHAYANVVDFGGEVDVFGMRVRSGDLIHADRHGAVVVPVSALRELPAAAQRLAAREARILAVARAPGCTAERLIEVFNREDEIH